MANFDLNIHYRETEHTTDIHYLRNYHAVQSALFRGNREISVENISKRGLFRELRCNHDSEDGDPAKPLQERYPAGRGRYRGDYRDSSAKSDIALVEWEGFKLEFNRILAAGGFGAAALWDVTFEDGKVHQVVVKRGVTEDFEALDELGWHQRYAGNMHVVQPIDLHEFGQLYRKQAKDAWMADKHNKKEPTRYTGQKFDMVKLNVLVLEYMPHGSLSDTLREATRRKINFPTKALWEMWECFVRGLAAVAFQPKCREAFTEPFERLIELAEEGGEENLEQFLSDMDDTVEISHDVHFDLEEQNILVGESRSHTHAPIFKIHDFGDVYSIRMDEAWQTWGEKEYWAARMCPKRNRLTPEQVHESWDDLICHPRYKGSRFSGSDLTDRSKCEIAGRYGSWTNVFHIADVMVSVATKVWLNHPFTAKQYKSSSGKVGKTYGWRLMEPKYAYIEEELRDIICQCMFERPSDRPRLGTLLRQVYKRKGKGFDKTTQEMRAWWQEFFSPKPPSPIIDDEAEGSSGGVLLNASSTEPNTAQRVEKQQLALALESAMGEAIAPPKQDRKGKGKQPALRIDLGSRRDKAKPPQPNTSRKPARKVPLPDTASMPRTEAVAQQIPLPDTASIPGTEAVAQHVPPEPQTQGSRRDISERQPSRPRAKRQREFESESFPQPKRQKNPTTQHIGPLPDLVLQDNDQLPPPLNRPPLNNPRGFYPGPGAVGLHQQRALDSFGVDQVRVPESRPTRQLYVPPHLRSSDIQAPQTPARGLNPPRGLHNRRADQPAPAYRVPRPRATRSRQHPNPMPGVFGQFQRGPQYVPPPRYQQQRRPTNALYRLFNRPPPPWNPYQSPATGPNMEPLSSRARWQGLQPPQGRPNVAQHVPPNVWAQRDEPRVPFDEDTIMISPSPIRPQTQEEESYGSILLAHGVGGGSSDGPMSHNRGEERFAAFEISPKGAPADLGNTTVESEEAGASQDQRYTRRPGDAKSDEPAQFQSIQLHTPPLSPGESTRNSPKFPRIKSFVFKNSKISKRASKKRKMVGKPYAQKIAEAAERDSPKVPFAIQNLIIRVKALETLLEEDEPKKGEKKRKGDDKEEKGGKKK